jgi:hypothetical protein
MNRALIAIIFGVSSLVGFGSRTLLNFKFFGDWQHKIDFRLEIISAIIIFGSINLFLLGVVKMEVYNPLYASIIGLVMGLLFGIKKTIYK